MICLCVTGLLSILYEVWCLKKCIMLSSSLGMSLLACKGVQDAASQVLPFFRNPWRDCNVICTWYDDAPSQTLRCFPITPEGALSKATEGTDGIHKLVSTISRQHCAQARCNREADVAPAILIVLVASTTRQLGLALPQQES